MVFFGSILKKFFVFLGNIFWGFGFNMFFESFVSKSYCVICEEDILGIFDLVMVWEYMKSWGVKKKGIWNMEDVI